jgi:hypothetical protein
LKRDLPIMALRKGYLTSEKLADREGFSMWGLYHTRDECFRAGRNTLFVRVPGPVPIVMPWIDRLDGWSGKGDEQESDPLRLSSSRVLHGKDVDRDSLTHPETISLPTPASIGDRVFGASSVGGSHGSGSFSQGNRLWIFGVTRKFL